MWFPFTVETGVEGAGVNYFFIVLCVFFVTISSLFVCLFVLFCSFVCFSKVGLTPNTSTPVSRGEKLSGAPQSFEDLRQRDS